MAPHEQLGDIIEFAQRFTAAQAALALAALGEPNDDAYLALESEALAFFAPESGLLPSESRWPVPGGTTASAVIDASDSVGPGIVYAAAEFADGAWVALLSGLRDRRGRKVQDALRVERIAGELAVTGRAQLDPFTNPPTWAHEGGKPVPIEGPFTDSAIERVPTDPAAAALIKQLDKR